MRNTITNFLNYRVQYKWINCNYPTLGKISLIISVLLLFCSNNILGQGLKQTTKQWPEGEPSKVEYLNDDLKIIKEEFYDPDGVKVASYSIDPETQKFHGEFFDGTNKGSYNQGILTAQNFRIIDASSRNVDVEIIINVKDGILQGQAIKNVYRHDPPFTARLQNNGYVGNDRVYIRFEKFINKKYQEHLIERNIKDKQFSSKKYILKFDENGLIHGDHFIDRFRTMIFDHGECTGILTYDGNAGYNDFDDNHNFIGVKGYALDSVFRDQKIWKRNFKLIKNCGFIEGYTLPNIYNVDQLRLLSFNAYDYGVVDEKKIFTGQEVFKGQNYPALTFFNSDVSIVPNHFGTRWIETERNEFLFEFRTAILDGFGFFYNEESSVISVFTPHNWSSTNYYNYHVDTIEHFKLIFALQNLHCSLINLGVGKFN